MEIAKWEMACSSQDNTAFTAAVRPHEALRTICYGRASEEGSCPGWPTMPIEPSGKRSAAGA